VQLAERALPPRRHILAADRLGDRHDLHRRDRAAFHLGRTIRALEQVTQLAHRGPGAVELGLEPVEVIRDQALPRSRRITCASSRSTWPDHEHDRDPQPLIGTR
jgi:hypothetical protein